MNDLRERAQVLGLDRLTAEHLAQLERAAVNMKRHIERLPRNLTVADEPAHIYRAKERSS